MATQMDSAEEPISFPQKRLQATYTAGARLLAEVPDWEPEPLAAAIAVEAYRWAWRPECLKIILIAESHIYTSADDLALSANTNQLSAASRDAVRLGPQQFARIIYCLGYGEPELLAGSPSRRNAGTRQFWDLFGRLAGTGLQPRKGDGHNLAQRLQWKISTLQRLQKLGIWVLDASVHAIYAPGGQRLPDRLKLALHRHWWEDYGSFLLAEQAAEIWIIGKTVADTFARLGVSFAGWIYQPGAGRSPKIDLNFGWEALLARIAATSSFSAPP
ncbi:MAG: hypothetical protein AAFY11_03180 [Cyanobacteria bacterium J06641_5]